MRHTTFQTGRFITALKQVLLKAVVKFRNVHFFVSRTFYSDHVPSNWFLIFDWAISIPIEKWFSFNNTKSFTYEVESSISRARCAFAQIRIKSRFAISWRQVVKKLNVKFKTMCSLFWFLVAFRWECRDLYFNKLNWA